MLVEYARRYWPYKMAQNEKMGKNLCGDDYFSILSPNTSRNIIRSILVIV